MSKLLLSNKSNRSGKTRYSLFKKKIETEKPACVNKTRVQVTSSGNSHFDDSITSLPAFQSRTYLNFSMNPNMIDMATTALESSNAPGESF